MATRRWYEPIGQEVIEETLENGLQVTVLPKPGFQTRYATFATRYGGMDNEFLTGDSDGTPTTVPAGIAHFLEHKMFEQPDGTNVTDIYSRMGVDANAATYKNRTVYMFTATDNDRFARAFDILLSYVQTPYFTDENVSKEQGIIQQEITSGLDRPWTVAMHNFDEAMYHLHPAGTSIAGTIESVAKITKEDLYLCHRTFYHPTNMRVVVSGDVDAYAVIDAVKRDMDGRDYSTPHEIRRPAYDEPQTVRAARVTKEMKVSRPLALLGFKGPALAETQAYSAALRRRRLLGSLVGEALFGRTTQWYWELYSKGIVTSSFGCDFSDFGSACHLLVGGETEDQERLVGETERVLISARDNGVPEEDFELARRSAMGRVLSNLDSPDDLTLRYVGDAMDGIDTMTSRQALEALNHDEATEFLRQLISEERRVVSTVVPMPSRGEGN